MDEEIPSECCDAVEDQWFCTLPRAHEGPHEAWGLDRLMCRWGPSPRSKRQDIWRDHIVQDMQQDIPGNGNAP